jgi:hypothetical protein
MYKYWIKDRVEHNTFTWIGWIFSATFDLIPIFPEVHPPSQDRASLHVQHIVASPRIYPYSFCRLSEKSVIYDVEKICCFKIGG